MTAYRLNKPTNITIHKHLNFTDSKYTYYTPKPKPHVKEKSYIYEIVEFYRNFIMINRNNQKWYFKCSSRTARNPIPLINRLNFKKNN